MFDITHINLIQIGINALIAVVAVLKIFGKHNQVLDKIRALTQELAQFQSPTSEEGTHLSALEKALLIEKLEKVLEELRKDKDKL